MNSIQRKFFLNLFFYFLVLGVIFWFGILNFGRGVVEKVGNIKKIRGQIELEGQKSQRLRELKEISDLLSKNEEKINQALPSEKESGRLLAQIEFLAQREGCLLSEFRFSQEASQKGAGSKEAKKEEIEKLPFSFTIEADYSNFLRFLEGLDKLPRLVKVESLSLELKEGKLKGAFNAFAYFHKEANGK